MADYLWSNAYLQHRFWKIILILDHFKVCDSLTWAYFLYPVSKCRLDVEVNYWKHKQDFIFARWGWRANVPSYCPELNSLTPKAMSTSLTLYSPPFYLPAPPHFTPMMVWICRDSDWLLMCKIKMAVSSTISRAGFYFPQGHRSLELFGLFFYFTFASVLLHNFLFNPSENLISKLVFHHILADFV